MCKRITAMHISVPIPMEHCEMTNVCTKKEHHVPIELESLDHTDNMHTQPVISQFMILWDICTILLSLTAGVYTTHMGMRDKCFPHLLNNTCESKAALQIFFGYIPGNLIVTFIDLWCVADIIFSVLMQSKYKAGSKIRYNYLKTWFLVDVVSMLSWEVIFVQPVLSQKKRLIQRVIDICRMIPLIKKRWPHLIKICHVVKAVRCRPSRLCRFVKFAPKYIIFMLKMKIVILLRVMRHIRLQRRLIMNIVELWNETTEREPAGMHIEYL